jgi:hypothetical protein
MARDGARSGPSVTMLLRGFKFSLVAICLPSFSSCKVELESRYRREISWVARDEPVAKGTTHGTTPFHFALRASLSSDPLQRLQTELCPFHSLPKLLSHLQQATTFFTIHE